MFQLDFNHSPPPHVFQGNTGILMGMFLVSIVILVALITVLSGIGVCERCGIGSGGVYSMVSTILGGQVGGTVGLLYIFGQVGIFTSGGGGGIPLFIKISSCFSEFCP